MALEDEPSMTGLWPMRPLTEAEVSKIVKADESEARYFHAKSFLEEWRKEITEK